MFETTRAAVGTSLLPILTATLWLPLLCLPGAAAQGQPPAVPREYAVLEVELPPGAKVRIDGTEEPKERRFRYGPLKPNESIARTVQVTFRDGTQRQRTVYLQSGWHVLLTAAPPDSDKPEQVLQAGHSGRITSVAMSGDGKLVLTASEDHTAILWDAETGLLLRALRGHHGSIASAAFSPDSRKVITGSADSTAIVWDVASGARLRTFRAIHPVGTPGIVLTVAFSPDGSRALAGTLGFIVSIWDVDTGKELVTLSGQRKDENHGVGLAAFSPDGRQVITGDWTAKTNPLILWNAKTGERLRTFPLVPTTARHESRASVAFSPDGRFILSSVENAAVLYDVATGEARRSFQGHKYSVRAALFSKDGRQMVTGSADHTAILWDATTGQQLKSFQGHSGAVTAVAFGADGRRLLTGSDDHTALLWDLATGAILRRFQGLTSAVNCMTVSPDGQQLLTGSAAHYAVLWDTSSSRGPRLFHGHAEAVNTVAFTPDGRKVITGSSDRRAILWDAAQAQQLGSFQGSGGSGVDITADGRRILTGDHLSATIWNTDGKRLQTFVCPSPLSAVGFGGEGNVIVTGGGEFNRPGEAIVWDAVTGTAEPALRGHSSHVTAVALSPDGKRVLTGSWDHTAILWDRSTGKRLHTLVGHSQPIQAVRFAPDGRTVLTGANDKTAILWDVQSGKTLHVFERHTSSVFAVAFSPDGEKILTGSLDKSAILWDVRSRKPLRTLREHTGSVYAVGFASAGRHLLTGSSDGTVIVWDVDSGERLRHLKGPATASSLACSRMGDKVIVGSRVEQVAILWEARTGERLLTLEGAATPIQSVAVTPDGLGLITGGGRPGATVGELIAWSIPVSTKLRHFSTPPGSVGALAISPDGKRLLGAESGSSYPVSKPGQAVVWDLASGERLRQFRGNSEFHSTPAAMSRDGTSILTGADDHLAILWDAATGAERQRFATGHTGKLQSVVLSPDGGKVLTASEDHTARIWNAVTGQPERLLQGHKGVVWSAVFSPDGRSVATGSSDGTAVLWDAATGKPIRTFHGKANMLCLVAFSPNGRYLLTGSSDRLAILWEVATGERVLTYRGHGGNVIAGTFSSDGRFLLTGAADNTAILWDARNAVQLKTFQGHTQLVCSVDIHPDGKRIVTCSPDGRAILWDVETARAIQEFRPHPHLTMYVWAVGFSPNGKYFLTASQDARLNLWDAVSGKHVRTIAGHAGSLYCAKFSADSRQVITGSDDRSAILWNVESGAQVQTYAGSKSPVCALAVSPNGQQVVTATTNNLSRLWDVASGRLLYTFQGHSARITSVVFTPSGRHILTSSEDGTTRVWDAATGDEIARLISIEAGKDWAVVTPEGLFDGSREGREKVFFRFGRGLDIVPLDRFFQDCYYPGLLAELWQGRRPLPGKPPKVDPAPLVKILAEPSRAENNQAVIDVALTDQGGGSTGPWLFHNGAAVRSGHAFLRKEHKTDHHRFRVPLVPGVNRFEVRAASADGSWESEPAVARLSHDGQSPAPELYVVAVGVDRFAQDAGVAKLDFCVSDARTIGELFRKRVGTSYARVHVSTLFDEQATKRALLKAVTTVAEKARAQDTLVLYVGSHGFTVGQRFYLIPHDFRLSRETSMPPEARPGTVVGLRGYRQAGAEQEAAVRQHGLAIDELGEALATVPALKRVLIFDTCHSGSAIQLAGKQNNPFAFRGAIERFSRAQGVYSLSATAADELAAETKELGHSILTYALLAGANAVERGPLVGKGLPGQGELDVLAWFRYARAQVPALYQQFVGRPQHVEFSGDDQPSFALIGSAPK